MNAGHQHAAAARAERPAADGSYFRAWLEDGVVRTFGTARIALGHRVGASVRDTPAASGAADDEGAYAEWSFESGALVAATDRYGMQPLYVAVGRDHIAISPSICALIAGGAPRDLDLDALAVFLHVGFFLADETPFKAIRALPPGARLRWIAGKCSIEGGIPAIEPAPISRDRALDAYVDLFRRSMRRRPAGTRAVLPLSGGRDSRHILFELLAGGRAPDMCVTARYFPPRPDEDAVAATLARAVGCEHTVLAQGDELETTIAKNVVSGFCADEHAWFAVVAAFISDGYDTAYDGLGGDVLSAGLFLTPGRMAHYAARRYADVARDFLQERYEATLSQVLVPELRGALSRERARERVAAEMAKYVGAGNPIGAFCFWNRTRREIALAPFAMVPQDGRLKIYTPYLDRAVFDFLTSLPAALLADRSFHSETIARAFPEHAAIPYMDAAQQPAGSRTADRRFAESFLCSRWASASEVRSGALLVRDFARRVRLCTMLDALRRERRRLDPRLVLYLRQLESIVS